jgi:Putative transmembrane protein (PGPGW)
MGAVPSKPSAESAAPARTDALGGQRPVPPGSFRDRMRSRPGTRLVWRAVVFLGGLLCIAGGCALVVLPGPLTIPPIILGLWIWSTEFEWAHKLFAVWKEKGQDAWRHAKRHPVTSSMVTVGGLVLAGVVVWAVLHYDLIDRAKQLVGLS